MVKFLQFAENELSAAKFNLAKFPLTAYKSAYDALIHSGNALIRFYGYRPTNKFTPLEKATDKVGGNYLCEDGGLKPPSSNTVRERSSLTSL